MFLLPAVGAAAVVGGFVAYATHDRLELLDLPPVSDRAEVACAHVARSLDGASGLPRAERVAVGNAAIDELVATMTALGQEQLASDRPATAWIADWEALRRAREDVADALGTDAEAALVMPQTPDGFPITGRMIAASGDACGRAIMLAAGP